MEVLAIIPARGGSKGIPMKNIQKLCGKPLIAYSIETAKQSKFIDRIIVTTDHPKIAKIAESYGAEIPFLRPKKYSRDNSSQLDFIQHTLKFFEKNESYIPDIVVVLHPTSPLRTSERIDKSIRMLQRSKSDIVLGVFKIKTHPYRSFWYKNKFLKPFKSDFLKFYQRQLFPPLYFPTGEVYTFWTKNIKKYNSIYGPKIKPLLPDKNLVFIDIDHPIDLFLAEKLYSKK